MDFPTHYHASSPRETQKLGEELAIYVMRHLEVAQATVITLEGCLGAGKTTFLQGFARGLGLDGRLTSPTYIIAREYELPSHLLFYHIDLYRITKKEEIEGLGISEMLNKEGAIVAIEWPEKLGLLAINRYALEFTLNGENERDIVINSIKNTYLTVSSRA